MLKQAVGLEYHTFLGGLHGAVLFDWYLEVGCRKGDSFAPVRGKTVAVDPFFRLRRHVMNVKPALLLCQMTSDDFFAQDFLGRLGVRVSFSFLDGMHLFEYLLRDFINTEARSLPGGVIALHDCCPFNLGMTTRDLANLPRKFWTGDVWKLIPILKEYRPDLVLRVLDCAPTGLVLVTGLDPENTILRDRYDEIVARFAEVDLAAFGTDRFAGLFAFESAEAMMQDGFVPFRHLALDPASVVQPTMVTP
jgi:hypothetical protein